MFSTKGIMLETFNKHNQMNKKICKLHVPKTATVVTSVRDTLKIKWAMHRKFWSLTDDLCRRMCRRCAVGLNGFVLV